MPQAWRERFAPEIIGESPEVLEAVEMLSRAAATDCSILITGETGTGKELFARGAHRGSARRSQAFVPVNCAAIPESLLETELFGHVKGAYTGATNSRAGRFMAANGGTIFLDEIGDLPLAAQAKLLRVLEARVISPVGSDAEIPVDVRIVAATHRNLEEMVAAGTFRADLYFRLAVVPIHLPALRERGEDIVRIAESAVARAAARLGREVTGLDESAIGTLKSYAWPGNIRELSHMIERAVLLARKSVLTDRDFNLPGQKTRFATKTGPVGVVPAPVATPAASGDDVLDLRTALENLEKQLIDRALTKAGGNRTEAAALLGLNRTTLVEKLRKYAV